MLAAAVGAQPFPLAAIVQAALTGIQNWGATEESGFDPKVYGMIQVKRSEPMMRSVGKPKTDEGEEQKEINYHVSWRFSPVTVGAGNGIPTPPNALKCGVDVSMPSGKLGCVSGLHFSSRIRPRKPTSSDTATQKPPNNSSGPPPPPDLPPPPSPPSDDDDKGSNKPAQAQTWDEYKKAVEPIIDLIMSQLASSSYLYFPKPITKARFSDSMHISVEGDLRNKFEVRCDTGSTVGWGNFDAATNKWSGLRHKHKARSHDSFQKENVVYEGPNFEDLEKLQKFFDEQVKKKQESKTCKEGSSCSDDE